MKESELKCQQELETVKKNFTSLFHIVYLLAKRLRAISTLQHGFEEDKGI
jgi:hypothetical protein